MLGLAPALSSKSTVSESPSTAAVVKDVVTVFLGLNGTDTFLFGFKVEHFEVSPKISTLSSKNNTLSTISAPIPPTRTKDELNAAFKKEIPQDIHESLRGLAFKGLCLQKLELLYFWFNHRSFLR